MSAPPVREITAILVSWRDAEELAGAVQTLAAARAHLRATGPRASLVVVDNEGKLGGEGFFARHWADVRLLINSENRGFGAAANQGAQAAGGDVLLFLNPDTRAEADSFTEIARAFDEHPEAVAVAPRLLDADREPHRNGPLAPPDREDQRTFQLRRLPTLGTDARELLLLDHLFPDNAARRRERYAEQDRETPFAVEQAAAAALAIRRDTFLKIGGFDERFFPAWFEDVDLCSRLASRGTILYWPAARFLHRGRASSDVLGYACFLPVYYRNALRYRERYPRLSRWAYRLLLAAGMLLRLAALPVRPTVPRARVEAAKAYLRTLGLALSFRPKFEIRNPKSEVPS